MDAMALTCHAHYHDASLYIYMFASVGNIEQGIMGGLVFNFYAALAVSGYGWYQSIPLQFRSLIFSKPNYSETGFDQVLTFLRIVEKSRGSVNLLHGSTSAERGV